MGLQASVHVCVCVWACTRACMCVCVCVSPGSPGPCNPLFFFFNLTPFLAEVEFANSKMNRLEGDGGF